MIATLSTRCLEAAPGSLRDDIRNLLYFNNFRVDNLVCRLVQTPPSREQAPQRHHRIPVRQ
jgi:hypothetical protein